MSKTTSRISSEDSFPHRLSIALFSLLRYFKDTSPKTPTAIDARAVVQYVDNPTLAPGMGKKEALFFRFIEFLYAHILSVSTFFFRCTAKIARVIFYPIRKICVFLFEILLNLTEWIYTSLLDPFYNRFGYIFQGTLMVLKSKPLAMVLFVVISSFLARAFLMGEPRHIVIYAFVPFTLLLVFFYPIIGLCFYLLFGLGMLHKMIWHFPAMYMGSPLILAASGAYLVRIIIGREREFTWVHDNQNLVIMAMWSIMTVANFFGWYNTYFYLAFVTWFTVYFLAIQIIGSHKHRLIIFLYTLCLIYGIYAYQNVRNAFYYGTQTEHTVTVQVKGRMSDNNELSACLNMALPLFLGLFLISQGVLLKSALLSITILDIAAIIYANSRGGMLCLGVLMLPIIFKLVLMNRKNRKKGAIVILVLAVLFVSFFQEKVGKRIQSITNWKTDSSAKNRIIGFVTGMRAMIDEPLYGIGAGNMRLAFFKYCPETITIRYWFGDEGVISLSRPEKKSSRDVVEVHNAYAAVGAESGVFVLFLWVFLLINSIRNLRLTRKALPKIPENEWAHVLSHALELSTVSYMITACFLNNFSEGFIYMILAASLSLRHIALRRKGSVEIASIIWFLLLFGIWNYYTVFTRFFGHLA